MDVEAIIKRLSEQAHYPKAEAKGLIEEYASIPLTLPVNDESMRRICEVLTLNGYRTFDSCQGGKGHDRKIPDVWFLCHRPDNHVRHLAYILDHRNVAQNLHWEVSLTCGDPSGNLYYILQPHGPKNLRRTPIDPVKDREELLIDIDVIGITLMDYFSDLKRK